jgi:signal transduction histidine kinase
MDKLIDDLLSLSYLENQELEIHTIDLSKIVENITGQLSPQYQETNFTLKIEETPPTRADENMVTIMLTNLLTNAYKFTANQSQPQISFGCKGHNGGVTYYLQDNGIGFSMEYAEKIFAPFERLHSSEYEGTGIGLAIARRVIQRHKGRIWAASEEGKGTTFYFSFGKDQAIT